MKKAERNTFTLIELLIVIAIYSLARRTGILSDLWTLAVGLQHDSRRLSQTQPV